MADERKLFEGIQIDQRIHCPICSTTNLRAVRENADAGEEIEDSSATGFEGLFPNGLKDGFTD
jgi:hypothetical protein